DVTDTSDDPSNPADADPDGDGNPDDPTVTPLGVQPAIALGKTASLDKGADGVAGVGDVITYTLTVTNTGNVTLSDIAVDDARIGYAGTVASLAPGAVSTLSATYALTQADLDAGSVENTALATGKDPDGTDVTDTSDDPSNPADADPDGDGNPDDPTVTPLGVQPAIALGKTASLDKGADGVAGVGDVITYTLTVTNTGNVTLADIAVDDARIGYAGTVASLAPGAVSTLSATYALTQADLDAGTVVNQATATGQDPDGADVTDTSDDPSNPADADPDGDGNPDDPTVTPLPASPQLGVAKAAKILQQNADGSFDVSYTVIVANTGNVSLSRLQLRDDLSAGDQLGAAFQQIVEKPRLIFDNQSGRSVPPVLSSHFDGTANHPDLFDAQSGELAVGDRFSVVFTARINPEVENPPARYANIAVAHGSMHDGVTVHDASDTGTDPTVNPGGEGTPTIVVPPPSLKSDITISKVAGVATARRGDRVGYTIRIANRGKRDASKLTVIDTLPAGFIYVPGSAKLDGKDITVKADGRNLSFGPLIVPAKGAVALTLYTRVGANVEPGEHTNVAVVRHTNSGELLAPPAKAVVRIEAEHVFDCGEIIGKVFDDRNRNGYQDDGEDGLPGVRLATVGGILITTDQYGRYNVPCAAIPDADIGSNFILKLDVRTLPTGYRLTTENPRVVRLTRGKLTKLNFGASSQQVLQIDVTARALATGEKAISELSQTLERLIDERIDGQISLRIVYHSAPADDERPPQGMLKLQRAIDLMLKKRHWEKAVDIEMISARAANE
ncbi:hypothetical protein, partial [Pararhizobium sp. YC-54]|uniref:DUF7507 domain-containing protein n=1 Tax=Pararhizobium sp. YC-54 TaxID=2986920 RepID=UPI0021F76192